MAERDTKRIARDILSGPHVRGRRISVRQIYALVEERDEDPEAVADRFDLDVADVYQARSYYKHHPREMREVGEARCEAIEAFDESVERPDSVPDA